jgi:hypothetical protein
MTTEVIEPFPHDTGGIRQGRDGMEQYVIVKLGVCKRSMQIRTTSASSFYEITFEKGNLWKITDENSRAELG